MQTALDTQIGGDHYKSLPIQPVEFSHLNKLCFLSGSIVKRICRYNLPGGKGAQDLQKSIHEIDLLLHFISRNGIQINHHTFFRALPISPPRFAKANHLAEREAKIISHIVRHNMIDGDDINDLIEAKRITQQLLREACCNG